jgi:hypothetical protein
VSVKFHRASLFKVSSGIALLITIGILLHNVPENNEFMRLDRAIKALGQQFSVVKDRDGAEAAIETWRSIMDTNRLNYPRSFSHVEALEAQRRRASERIRQALALYAGQDSGTNVSQWEAWIKTNAGVSGK